MSFDNDPTAGTTLVLGSIHSPNYAQGAAGWTINKDGSAEFQNVLVRGTITASNIIGSTITGGTITGGDFQSANFSNAGQVGFDLNANATPDAAGTPGNTIQVYSNFIVGPPAGDHISLTYTGGQAQVELFTGLAGETVSASVFAEPFPTTTPGLVFESAAMSNGVTRFAVIPSDNAAGGVNDVGRAFLQTVGTTVPPTGGNLLKGVFNIGDDAADTWAVVINSENTVSNAQPALVIGDTFTPRSRLFVSPSEILSVDGSGNSETLYLNETNAEAVIGTGPSKGIANKGMRHASGFDVTQYNPTAAYANPTTVSMAVVCPASGTVTVILKFCVVNTVNVVAASFLVGSIKIQNNTSATTVFAASDNRGAEIDGAWIGATAGTGIVTLSYNVTASGLGNAGDSLTVTPQFRQGVAGNFNIKKTEMSVIPSL